jgi:hypothetical protein
LFEAIVAQLLGFNLPRRTIRKTDVPKGLVRGVSPPKDLLGGNLVATVGKLDAVDRKMAVAGKQSGGETFLGVLFDEVTEISIVKI